VSGREDFLAAIRGADPEDDTPTLIYADWLEERGDLPAAEIIRVQVELERGELHHGHEERRELLGRERELLKQHEEAWKRELSQVACSQEMAPRVCWGSFRRGLVRSAWFSLHERDPDRKVDAPDYARIFRESAATDLTFQAGAGLVDFLRRDLREEATGIAIAGVHYQDKTQQWVYEGLAGSGPLPRLISLNLRSQGIGDAGLKVLRPAPWFAPLRELNLRSNGLTAAALASLPDGRLRDLGLGMNRFSKDGVRVLVGRPFFAGLRSLELSFMDLDAGAAELIGRGMRDGNARRLNLRANRIGDEGLIALLRSGALEGVTDLDVNCNQITDRGARELIRSQLLPAWVRLDISVNDLGVSAKQELRERFGDEVIAGSEAKPGEEVV
jgi:uncharacterized protein (TIGR02996 family)